MQTAVRQSSIPIPRILPAPLQPWADPLAPALRKILIPGGLIESLEEARQSGAEGPFAARLLERLDIRFSVSDRDLSRIPARGAAVVTANHPYGIVDGLILLTLLARVRPDFKILANSWLRWIEELRPYFLFVNPFETAEAKVENRGPLRRAISFLAGGGVLGAFPSGEVAHFDLKRQCVSDPDWKPTAARLALRAGCPFVPVFFEGANSLPFQLAGMVHPHLRTMGLAREFAKMRGRTIRVRVGSPLPLTRLAHCHGAEDTTAYIRCRTFFLANRSRALPALAPALIAAPAVISTGQDRLLSEIAALPADCELNGDRNFSVYLADSAQIPALVEEIGRCRETAFRRIGEGSGRSVDLDRFDEYYQHLFLWNRTDSRLAGGYRLAVTSDVIPRLGISGLYTSTLFRYHPDFFQRVGPAVELGRSFIALEYQKNYAALLLLWKGIARTVSRRPEAPLLFGAVSISQTYSPASRSLIAAYLSRRARHEFAGMVAPRRKFREDALRDPQIARLAAMSSDIEDISLAISDIEEDGKGIPVLVRQYLKAGGRVLGFSVDPAFSNSLDALIMADLRAVPEALLERCLRRPAQMVSAG